MKRTLPMLTPTRRLAFILLLLAALLSAPLAAQTPDPTITALFQNSYRAINAMRLNGGIYLDALSIDGATNKPAALAANGVGLYALCIADAMYKKTGDAVNWDANAEKKALQTINEWIRLKNTPGAVNVNGLFHRYFNPSDGSWVWVTEHSTIDNAILAAGFLLCKNYFRNNAEIVSKTTTLLNSMDFTAAITPGADGMYMILDDNGVGSNLSKSFNEYMVLAWFAKNSNPSFPGYSRAQTFWANEFASPAGLPKFEYPAGNPTLSFGSSVAQPSFHVQFCYYYCDYFAKNKDYMTYFANMAIADKTWWQNNTNQQSRWGCGAGETPGGGYSADAVNNNPKKIYSAPIMAGFSPVYADVRKDLLAAFNNGTGSSVYYVPGTTKSFMWRANFTNPTLRTPYVQAVDFSTMLYGLAALPEYLGTDFFRKYTDFNYDPSVAAAEDATKTIRLSAQPNPFSDRTTIQFELPQKARVALDLYDLNGRKVTRMLDKELPGGAHNFQWSALNDGGKRLAPGAYICRMQVDGKPAQAIKIFVAE